MLNKSEFLFLVLIFLFTLVSSLSVAYAMTAITCSPCDVGDCVCSIQECSSGILRIYTSSSCRIPKYEYTFFDYRYKWNAPVADDYWFKALCSDGKTTDCISYTVSGGEVITTTTIKTTTTTMKGACKLDIDCPGDEECVNKVCKTKVKTDYTWIFILLAVIIVIFVLVFFIFGRRPKQSFDQLYRKWNK